MSKKDSVKMVFVKPFYRIDLGSYRFAIREPQVGDILKDMRCEALKNVLPNWKQADLRINTRTWENGQMELEVGPRMRVITR